MPRNHNPGPSTLRNRNRVTNKTRLRIIKENIDADPLAFDEDEEKARVVSTAGVDAEDANEHHLQAVLSAASRHHVHRPTRAQDKKPHTAYIPIPDSTGLVDDYDQLYPSNRWRDPFSYIKTSESVEEAIADGLNGGFTYFMDERDKEWLDKNNEEARGEGTSAQGALSASGSGTRSSQRSAKAKGKEPDVPQAIGMSEDEFELVMGLFEKVTHEKTEFLHHGLERGAPFPPFSDYQDTFASTQSPDTFSTFSVPSWIPQPAQMLRFAKVVYPYWKERRVERGGHRVIPILNYDESDVKNESYICFRRRDVKAMRKTRASQASSSEKLMRLQSEFLVSYELANNVVNREVLKKEAALQSRAVWEKREGLVNLKRKFPSLGIKEDEELFYDKERVPKKPKVAEASGRLKLKRDNGELTSASHVEAVIRPKDRLAQIQSEIERDLLRSRERDHHWEDAIDNAYQARPVSFAQRHWKFIPPDMSSLRRSRQDDSEDEDPPLPKYRAIRIRRGRGGVLRVDRRYRVPISSNDDEELFRLPGRPPPDSEESLAEAQEISWRIRDRWRFDADDEPPVGPEGSDEQDRELIDDFDIKSLKRTMTLYTAEDHARLATDPTLYVPLPDGRVQAIVPFKLGSTPVPRNRGQVPPSKSNQMAALQAQAQAQAQSQAQAQAQAQAYQAGVALSMSQNSVTPISMQAQMKKMQPPMNVPQVRLSSNGGMRPPTTPTVAPFPSDVTNSQASSPHPTTPTQLANGHNGVAHHTSNSADTEMRPASAASSSGQEAPAEPPTPTPPNPPMQLKPPNPHHAMNMPNGYYINNYNPSISNTAAYMHANMQHSPLSIQQMQSLKSAFTGQDLPIQVNGNRPAAYMGHVVPNGANYNLPLGVNVGHNMNMNIGNMNMANMGVNLKLPASRPMQWASTPQGQSPDVRRQAHLSPSQGRASPAVSIAHSLSPHLHSGSPTIQGQQVSVQVSPSRSGQTPVTSPSLQQQQQAAVGGSGNGY